MGKKNKKSNLETSDLSMDMENNEVPAGAISEELISEEQLIEEQLKASEIDLDDSEVDLSEENELADFEADPIFNIEAEADGLLPEVSEEELLAEPLPAVESVEGTELDEFESANIEELEFVEEERLDSILESILFASDRPVSLNSMKLVFKGTNVSTSRLKRGLDRLAVELAGSRRGVTLEEVPGGFQIRTKVDNMDFLTRTLKARPFKLSGPALEVLAIIAYKQPVIKHEIDEIRGVESGHLLRALMEKGIVNFEGKSDLPGKPMQYGTTKKFMEIFGLRNLNELPTLSQIDELLPEGIGEEEVKKPTLSTITDSLSQQVMNSYSMGEEELHKITSELEVISTSSDFFEQEKIRQKQKKDAEKAQSIREAILVGEAVTTRDRNWLVKYDEALMLGQKMEDFDKDADVNQASSDAAPVAELNSGDDEEVLEDQTLFSDDSLSADGDDHNEKDLNS